ncbi:mediator complex subunit 13 C-terminal-domain-containing protein [Boeremia exigua]|uniref:mediator complex subunit 13 C-terminal-domain-containing protein n=1 Tax=Boeremia exigua TaxID=749465 RepID=UPI001E8CD63D|nr:mediator complex subunit 13 C-terminal-domain-containing protein [Boeremia exigua]KAH6629085.1 mediator complex subunit 13 C-terminal-domain-containing protein [Boeremia exigua]
MEFLKTCSTNAQVIGDFEAVAYQAVSVARNPQSAPPRDGSSDEDTRAVEAALRDRQLFVARDAARPWLWLFAPTTADQAGAPPPDLPAVDGYLIQREQAGFTKALEFARPPLSARYPTAASYAALTAAQNKAAAANGRSPPGQPSAPEQPTLDCFAVYDLFISSVIALVTRELVKTCAVTSLNYRTFVSKPVSQPRDRLDSPSPHWLTSIDVHWASSGTLVVSTFTEPSNDIHSLDDVASDVDLKQLVGSIVRVAPNGALGRIMTFDDPLHFLLDDTGLRRRKRSRRSNLEQSVEKWKSTVKRWLAWKGYHLPNLADASAWVRLRTALNTQPAAASSFLVCSEQDVLWPRALCYYHKTSDVAAPGDASSKIGTPESVLQWFEGNDSAGFRDPYDVAQDWFAGKTERDRAADNLRKAKKAKEDALHRKEEVPGLFPSSPLNTRIGTYGELQPVSGVYPTPPDGVAPGASIFTSDTTGVTCAPSNVILAPGGTNPAINLSAPAETPQQPATSPAHATDSENFAASNNDDLFGDDMDDGYEENAVGEDDFDFFDGPNDGDVDMADAPPPADTKMEAPPIVEKEEPAVKADDQEDGLDHLAALEKMLSASSQPPIETPQKTEEEVSSVIDHDVKPHADPDTQVHEQPLEKAPTPPLSPVTIRQALKASPKKALTVDIPQAQTELRRSSAFGPLSFSRKMSAADAKYQDGRYGVHADEAGQAPSAAGPTRPKSLRDVPLLTKLRYAAAVASANNLPRITPSIQGVDDSDSESESECVSSDVSDEDDEQASPPVSTPFTGGPLVPAKRKLPTDGNATPMSVTSFAESFGGDLLELQNLQLDDSSLLTFESSSWDWSLVKLSPPIERPSAGARYSMPLFPHPVGQVPDTPTSQPDQTFDMPEDKHMSGSDNVNVAQMVTEQVISATLDILGEDALKTSQHARSSTELRWAAVIKSVFPKAVDCTLPALAAVNDVFPDISAHAKGQRAPARKPNEPPPVPGSQMYLINPPFIRVRRGETPWDLLPPAIAFWEPLGLAPVNGPKNVVAFCVYPHSDSLRPCLESFLLHMQLAYDSCKLGTHTRVETVSEYENGLVPCKIPSPAAPRAVYKALRNTCIQLGKVLSARHANIREQHESKVDAFIIYMINPFDDPSALWELCASFWTLFQTYGQGSVHPSQPQKPDLVLQIIPIKYIASFDHPVILSSNTYIDLAREVYNRSPPSAEPEDKTPLPIASAPAFQLEEPIPRNVPFKLQSDPPQDLLRENSYMHLAYAISLDGTWLTAAWTDSCGKSQATSTYHLGTRPFNELAKEIWTTTVSILQARKVHWRVCIARAGVMDRDELETWVYLISCPTSLNLFITLLTVDTQPPYKLIPTPPASAQANPDTPTATPGVSPDPSLGLTPAATPSAEPPTDPTQDPDARLVDITDETWGVILAHRLHNSHSTNHFSPALISGLLVKRGPAPHTRAPGPRALAVNILWIGAVGSSRPPSSPFPPTPGAADTLPGATPQSQGNPQGTPQANPQAHHTSSLMWTPTPQTRATAENLLKEILQQFRGLGLLGRLRGVRGGWGVPWHVGVCERGVEGLGRVCGGRV